jgi:hypothetical protein
MPSFRFFRQRGPETEALVPNLFGTERAGRGNLNLVSNETLGPKNHKKQLYLQYELDVFTDMCSIDSDELQW